MIHVPNAIPNGIYVGRISLLLLCCGLRTADVVNTPIHLILLLLKTNLFEQRYSTYTLLYIPNRDGCRTASS